MIAFDSSDKFVIGTGLGYQIVSIWTLLHTSKYSHIFMGINKVSLTLTHKSLKRVSLLECNSVNVH